MEDKEKDYLSDLDGLDGIEAFIPEGGYDLEDILNEDFSTDGFLEGEYVPGAVEEEPPAPAPEPTEPEPKPFTPEPKYKAPEPKSSAPEPGYTAPAPEPIELAPEPQYTAPAPEPETREEPAAFSPLSGAAPETGDSHTGPEPDGGADAELSDDDGGMREPRAWRIPDISAGALALLGTVTLAAVLVCAAVMFDLTGAARVILLAGGLIAACVPMAYMSLDILRERDRIPPALMMLLAVLLLGISGSAPLAVVAAIFYDLCQACMSRFFERELDSTQERLQEKSAGLEKPLAQRLEGTLRETSYGRVRPVVRRRSLERLVVLGVLALTLLISVIVPLFDGKDFAKWAGRGAALLAVCAFTDEAAVLMTFLKAARTASEEGIYFSGSTAISTATEVTSVLFNKSGTLTDGNYRVVNVDPVRISDEQLLYLAVCAGAWSRHPLARAIREYAGVEPDRSLFTKHTEREGYGSIVSMDDGQILAAGNIDFMKELGVRGDMYIPGETCVFVAVGRTCVGRIDLADELKPDAVTVVHELRRLKVANVALMTGDNALNATNTGRRLGIAEVYSDCRPKDKVERLQYILDSQERDDRLMVVSSSGRDKEIMEMANISATLGMGDDVTDAYPDIVIASGRLTDLTRAMHISKHVRAVNTLSFFASAAIRVVCLILALTGALGLWGVSAVLLATQLAAFLLSLSGEK